MKNIYLTLIVSSILALVANGQGYKDSSLINYEDSLRKIYLKEVDSIIEEKLYIHDSINSIVSSYGMQVGTFKTNDGFSSSTEVSYFLKLRNKSLELGLYFSNETKIFEGFSFGHKLFLFRKKFNEKSLIEPYLMYNFIYRITYLDAPLSMYPERVKCFSEDDARYSSIEHYFGAGVEINAFQYFYINASAGFGRYLGSIKNPVYPDRYTGMYEGGDGWGGIYKIGIGIRIL